MSVTQFQWHAPESARSLRYNLRPDAGGQGWDPLRFFRLPFLVLLIMHLFRTCENFRSRSRKVRSPGHVKWPHLIKSLNAHQSYADWTIDCLETFNNWYLSKSVHKMYISEFSYRWPKVRWILWSLHYKWMEKFENVCFGRKPFESLSNLGLQVELAPWNRKLLPVTPPHDPKVSSGHDRSPAVFWQ